MTKHNQNNEEPLFKDANREPVGRPDQFFTELVHEFTDMVTAVIGYSELALHAIEDSLALTAGAKMGSWAFPIAISWCVLR